MSNISTSELQKAIIGKLDLIATTTENESQLKRDVYVLDVDGNLINPASSDDINNLISTVGSSGGTQLKSFSVEITRPANTTVYTAGDVVGDVSGVLKTISNVAKATGTGVRIYRVMLQTEDTGVQAGSKFNLHLYRDTPDTTGLSDNGAFSINYINASKRIGKIPVVMDSTIGVNDYNCIGLNPANRDVYAILETVSGFTPSANSTRFQITIDCELSNK